MQSRHNGGSNTVVAESVCQGGVDCCFRIGDDGTGNGSSAVGSGRKSAVLSGGVRGNQRRRGRSSDWCGLRRAGGVSRWRTSGVDDGSNAGN